MVNRIYVRQALPKVFADTVISSEVWKSEVCFQRGKRYLVKAISGGGKSSLCSFIYGYRKDYLGNILFDDEDISTFDETRWCDIRNNNISFLFQDLRLFDDLSALDNVMMKNKITNHLREDRIISLFDRLGLSDKVNTPVKLLSLGQQQRVAFIRSLCQPFDFVLMDEPISHLDDLNSEIIKGIIEEELSLRGAGIIITSVGKHIPIAFDEVLTL